MYSVKDAARMLGVSVGTVYKRAALRAIEHYRIGSRILFSDEQIQSYLEKTRVLPTEEEDAGTEATNFKILKL